MRTLTLVAALCAGCAVARTVDEQLATYRANQWLEGANRLFLV